MVEVLAAKKAAMWAAWKAVKSECGWVAQRVASMDYETVDMWVALKADMWVEH